jgi:hypothetical protein
VRHARSMFRRIKKKGGEHMALFTIMHIYEVPARNQHEATDELMLARKHQFDKVYCAQKSGHKKQILVNNLPYALLG